MVPILVKRLLFLYQKTQKLISNKKGLYSQISPLAFMYLTSSIPFYGAQFPTHTCKLVSC